MVFRRVLSTYRVIIDRLWAVSPYIFANCCSVGRSVVPSFRLVLGKPGYMGLQYSSALLTEWNDQWISFELLQDFDVFVAQLTLYRFRTVPLTRAWRFLSLKERELHLHHWHCYLDSIHLCLSLVQVNKMPSDKRLQSMRSFHRQSTTEDFVLSPESPLPDIAPGGARVRVK